MLEATLRRARGLLKSTVIALTLTATSASAATLTRGPYLQLLTTDSVTVVWNTDESAACSLAIRPLGGAPTIVEGGVGKVCAVAVDGLFPGAHYGYRPLADGAALDGESIFRTDDPWRPFSFLVLGDSGDGSADQYAVAERMEEAQADLILHTGDMVYEDGRAANYNPHYFIPYNNLLRRLVLWPCLGEDDTYFEGRTPWLDAFYTPANNADGLEEYYSFDYGNAHFVVLDTTHDDSPGSPMSQFLDTDLAASSALWKFVFLHKPLYSSRTSTVGRRRDLGPVFDRHHVDIVFNGDIHNYERTKSIEDEKVVPDGTGTVYVTTGGGGKSVGAVAWSDFTAYTESAFHFVRVSVDRSQLRFEMVRKDGQVRDTMTLTKDKPASCGDGEIDERAEQCDGDNDAACPGACANDCSCPPFCGDGVVNQPIEECDVADDALCPGACLLNCECAEPLPVLQLAPIADTYIDSEEITWDHGAAAELTVDASPERLTYLKFDLGTIRGSMLRATLALYVTDTSNDGGTVYPVADSSWIEGDRDGADSASAGGPGLKWIDVDTNDDGDITAADASPYVPDFSQPSAVLGSLSRGRIEVDVTAAISGGPGVYTLAIQSPSSEKALFASREDATVDRRPVLLVELAGSSCTQHADCDDALVCTLDHCHPISQTCLFTPDHGVCANGSFCDGMERCDPQLGCTMPVKLACEDGIACTIDSCNEALRTCESIPDPAACADGDVCTADICDVASGCQYIDSGLCRFLERDLVPMADTFVEAGGAATWDHGAGQVLEVDDSPKRITYLKFDLSGTTQLVSAATLMLHCLNGTPDGGTIYPVADSGWIEGDRDGADSGSAGGPGLKWSDLDTNGDGTLTDADTPPYLPDFAQPIASIGGVRTGEAVSVDITAALQGGPGVYTLAIVSEDSNKGQYASREHAEATMRPLLRLGLGCVTDADCDDGFACTVDTCDGGLCVSRPDDGRCNDGVGCTVDRCDPLTRQCVSVADGGQCDNGSYCDGPESCDPALGCLPGSALDCDDGLACTADRCEEALRRCLNEPNTEVCDDSDPCTTDTCDPIEGCLYSASGLCEATIIDIEAVADTFIEAGAGATKDHGAATDLKVDSVPLRLTYFKFDLSALRGSLTAATLTLYCTDPSPDGGTLYPVDDSSWIEGEQTDAAEPGLKFIDVDTNGDGEISAADASPFVPDFSRPIATLGAVDAGTAVSVDVTEALPGTEVYTLALKNDNRAGAFYASREVGTASHRPVLRVELPPVPPCNVDADCDDGLPCTLDRCEAGVCSNAPDHGVCNDGIPCTVDHCDVVAGACLHAPDDALCDNGAFCDGAEHCDALTGCMPGQPVACDDGIACTVDGCDEATTTCVHLEMDAACDDGDVCTADACHPTAGCQHASNGLCEPVALDLEPVADTHIDEAEATWDHGAAAALGVDSAPVRVAYLKFDLTAMTEPVERATLTLHCTNASSDGGTVYPVGDSSWVEGDQTGAAGPGLTFTDVDIDGDGKVTAADASPYAPDLAQPIAMLGAVEIGQTVTVDVTSVLQGGPRVYTLTIKNDDRSGAAYASREAADVTLRPVLHLDLPPVAPCAIDADCEDGIGCTVDRCEGGVCVQRADDGLCNDGVACTVDRCDPAAGACVHTPDDAACDDGLFCDGVETCDLVAGCLPGTPIDCDDGIACSFDACDNASASCVHTANHGACDDRVGCTVDVCDIAQGGCRHTADHLVCDNGVFCDGAELCDVVAGCVPGQPVDCDDGIACTVDTCEEAGASCLHEASDVACDDADLCTTDTCDPIAGCRNPANGLCEPVEMDLEPVADTSIEEAERTWNYGAAADLRVDLVPLRMAYLRFDLTAVTEAITRATLTFHCTDASPDGGTVYLVGDSSWAEGDQAGAAGPGLTFADVDTDGDGDVTTADASPYVPDFAHGIATLGAVEVGQTVSVDVTSALQGGPGVYTLALKNNHRSGAAYISREATDATLRPVLHLVLPRAPLCTTDSDCNDGIACTVDRCQAGACLSTADDGLCDDGVTCTRDTCDAAAGACVHRTDDTLCDNGLLCDGLETCDAVGGCLVGAPVDCDDGVVCTVDVCDEASAGCVYTPDHGACHDGVTCTVDVCDVATGGCRHAPDHVVCDNGVRCDGAEACDPIAGCVPGYVIDCDDGIACTTDACDEASGSCVHQAVHAACDDGDLCTTDTCDPTTGCQHPSNGLCEPVVADLEPIADTYIEEGAEATWDHGAAADLRVDLSPLRLTYLKFDLTAVTEPVERATLTLHCTNASSDGGTVYPVGDSSWVEGDQTGAAGPGLRFTDVDTDGNGKVTAADASPYVPDFTRAIASLGAVDVGQTLSVDVTAALQAGPGVYTLAIKNDDKSGAAYASRETADMALRPVLRVVLPTVPPCAVDSDCDDGIACTLDRCEAGACVHTADDPFCDDGVACTADACDVAAGGCVYTPDHVVCDNAVFCDGIERCDALAGCVPGQPVDCDDGVACTLDTCDEAGARCLHERADAACDDGDVCTADTCDPSAGCQHPSNGLCEPTELDLQAVADTYIQEGAEATWDHGAAPSFRVDLVPFRMTYLKFDLSGISEPILRATLTLHCVDRSDDGGTIYPVADSSWVEGDQTGADAASADGPGLKFSDVDTDGDGAITATDTSPYLPDFANAIATLGAVEIGQTLNVDVTAALQGGPAVYTLTLKNDDRSGASYASREAADATLRPLLRLQVAPAIP